MSACPRAPSRTEHEVETEFTVGNHPRDRRLPAARDVSVVICAYADERWIDLAAAVESVRRQSPPPGEIVVVVDHNRRLFDRVRHSLSDIVAVENAESPGLSGARNSGIATARGDIVAFLDDDAVASEGWLDHLLAGFGDHGVVAVGGQVWPVWDVGPPRWLPDEFHWVVGCSYRGQPTDSAPIRNPIGANMAFRREVFEEIGGFRSGIGRVGAVPVGCEETELCIRARQHWPHRTILYEPRAVVRHRVPAHRATWRYFRSRCLAEGRSKALVSGLVGADDGLASERTYTFKTLPAGALRGLWQGLARADLGGVGRAAMIGAGLALTTLGYLRGVIGSHIDSTVVVSRKVQPMTRWKEKGFGA